MSNVSRNLKDLNESSSQAIQALLDSIAPESVAGNGTKADAVKKLTEKLEELVGEDAMKEFNQGRNERGELVNEEGLPIIEITEPLTNASERGTGNSLLAEEEQLIQIETFPPPVRERWKQERDRILDILEEEEREEQKKEEQDDVEVREAILQKRRDAAMKEKERMKGANDMQKKMGKALLRDMAETRSKEEIVLPTSNKAENTKANSSKKTVSFAVESEDEESPSDVSTISKLSLDWGDVTPARLKTTSTRPLLRSSETLPMKMNVVEREPKNQSKINTLTNVDSDDESDPEETEDNEDDGNSASLGPRLGELDSVRSSVESESEGELILEEEEYDIDFAQHQREIALQYYEKRSSIGREALTAMTSHSHNGDGDDIPLDMPSSEPHPKPSISQFRANRIASAYSASAPSSSSVSLGASVLPAATVRTIQKAVRTGKVDADGRLVGGDFDSASEDEVDGMQDVLELLKKGEVYNLGPDGKYIHTIPPRNADGEAEASSTTSPPSSSLGINPLPVLNRPKISRFKLDRSQAGRPALHASSPSTTSDSKIETHRSDVRRPPPKMPVSSVIERRSVMKDIPSVTSSSSRMSSMSLSPSTPFVVPGSTASAKSRTGPAAMPSMVVESPSFAKPQPPMPSMIVESPSFARPANHQPHTIISSPSFPSPVSNQSTSRPTHPPTVLSSSILEASKAPTANKTTTPEPAKKISRFMADRM
ncbi:hypothetical protein BDZ94DRAFT_1303822 [Collybia nuda]|uniref:DUF3835 domain-containing protein n=1 Tax=Collybia nuda TaxID=64659 RepID=A0A9P5YG59_9AGAR|nr:hypothetical protein BDZ94DRAFT_1303822 [Collybia nuda]